MLANVPESNGHIGLICNQQVRTVSTDALCAYPDLLGRFLAGDIQNGGAGALGEGVGDGKQQG